MFHQSCGLQSRLGVLAISLASAAILQLRSEAADLPTPLTLSPATSSGTHDRRYATVADAITMVEAIRGAQYFGTSHDIAHFSPDGEHFVVILRKGNMEANFSDYTLVLFDTSSALQGNIPRARVVARLSSSSNRPGIDSVKWLNNRLIAFLGENPAELHQVYTVDTVSAEIRRLTNHATSVDGYDISADEQRVVFTADQTSESLIDDNARRRGIIVGTQRLDDLLRLQTRFRSIVFRDLFEQNRGAQEKRLRTKGVIQFGAQISISPNGRYVVVSTARRGAAPQEWSRYHDAHIDAELRAGRRNDGLSFFSQLELLDRESDTDELLLDAPPDTNLARRFVWAGDSRAVVVSGTYLPLDVRHPIEETGARGQPFVVEIAVPEMTITPIASAALTVHHWDSETKRFIFEGPFGEDFNEGPARAYAKTTEGWTETGANDGDLSGSSCADVTLEQNMNNLPHLIIKNRKSGHVAELLDLNPQLRDVEFGVVREISFKTADGATERAGLYFPPDYVQGRRYPLVIQTHGWNPKEFRIDGPHPTAFAAQPIAAHEMIVAQLSDAYRRVPIDGIPKAQAAAYEGVIDYLDRQKLIDRRRIGLVGFSYTGLGIQYALTHFGPRYHIEAAVHADANDYGYFYYLSTVNSSQLFSTDVEALNGGAPFGSGRVKWATGSSSAGLERVSTPLRLQANDPYSLWTSWEWFAVLLRLAKPVELTLLPEGTHVLVKPWDRAVSLQGNVDWFDFWLRGMEDASSEKAEQYRRWEQLCDMHRKNTVSTPVYCVPTSAP